MILSKNISIMISIGLALALLGGCGSGTTDDKKIDDGNSALNDDANGAPNSENNNSNPTGENNDTDPVVAGYVSNTGVLIETKSDGTKLAWVNDTGTACLIYRIAQRGGTILAGGTAHCEGLKHGGIDTWRMATEDEAVYLMENANTGETRLIYPDDNPNCQFMATSTGGRYVHTTNNPSTGTFDEPTRRTAGIRCVANQ